MTRWIMVASFSLLLGACEAGEGIAIGGGTDIVASTDVKQEEAGENDTLGPPDTSTADTPTTPQPSEPDIVSVPPDASPEQGCDPGEGCFGEPCKDAQDCLSGICTMHLGDRVCSKTCDALCPEGFACQLAAGSTDGQSVCVSRYPYLCLPCATSEGCSGDGPQACVRYPDGLSF